MGRWAWRLRPSALGGGTLTIARSWEGECPGGGTDTDRPGPGHGDSDGGSVCLWGPRSLPSPAALAAAGDPRGLLPEDRAPQQAGCGEREVGAPGPTQRWGRSERQSHRKRVRPRRPMIGVGPLPEIRASDNSRGRPGRGHWFSAQAEGGSQRGRCPWSQGLQKRFKPRSALCVDRIVLGSAEKQNPEQLSAWPCRGAVESPHRQKRLGSGTAARGRDPRGPPGPAPGAHLVPLLPPLGPGSLGPLPVWSQRSLVRKEAWSE